MKKLELTKINEEINIQLKDKAVVATLMATVFKGLTPIAMKQAIMEGVIRGFIFKDFLEKNVYAIPFGTGYSLVTSIDYARKIGMRSGVVGKSEPIYTEDEKGDIITCLITIKKTTSGIVGDFTAKVYFSEYNTGKNLWQKKPRTMIAKVAEMHALRMACPEELAKAYIEEEMEKEVIEIDGDISEEDKKKIDEIKTIEELKAFYLANKGKGKAFDKYVSARKKELTDSKK